MNRCCSICYEDKPSSEFTDRTFCRSCYNQKRRVKRATTTDTGLPASSGDVMTLEKLMANLNAGENIELSLDLVERIKSDLMNIRDKKMILSLPKTIAEPAFMYFKKCTELGMSLTRIQDNMYAKIPPDVFQDTFEVSREDFIKVSHELSFLIDYIRCLKDAYNQFVEDHNFNMRTIDSSFEKIKDIRTFYNFTTKSIEMSDNPLRLTQKTFLQKLRDETQNHYGLMYFHQKHYFDAWYEQYGIRD